MSFNRFQSAGSSDLSNGTAVIFAKSLKSVGFGGNLPCATNSQSIIETRKLDINDVNLIAGNPALSDLNMSSQDITNINRQTFNHIITPSAPAVGKLSVYSKSDNNLYILDSASTESQLVTGSSGDVVGPVSSINDNIAVFNGITGKIIADGGSKITDLGNVSSTGTFTADNRLIRSDGTARNIQDTGITIDDSDNITNVQRISLAVPTLADSTIYGNDNLGGTLCTVMGKQAMQNAAGIANLAIGYQALKGAVAAVPQNNVAVGNLSMTDIDSGANFNTSFGHFSSQKLTTGDNNSISGHQAAEEITTGSRNTSHGFQSLQNITINNDCIGIGYQAGKTLTSGNNNVYLSNLGAATESNVMRLGSSNQNTTFLEGTKDVVPALASTAVTDVIIDSSSQIGSASITTNSTGLVTGGVLTINADPTLFDISDGFGFIFDSDTLIKKRIAWSGLTAQSSGAHVGNLTHVAINTSASPVYFASEPTNQEKRDNISLGHLVHTGGSANFVLTETLPIQIHSSINQISDFAVLVGKAKQSGMVAGSNNLLTIFSTAGSLFEYGGNFNVNRKDPNFIAIALVDTNVAGTYNRILQDDSFTPSLTNILTTDYDVSGTLTTMPGVNDFQTMRIFQTANGTLLVSPGQVLHNSLAEALSAINTESFVTAPEMLNNGLLIGFLTVQDGATDLSDAAEAVFTQAGKFQATSGGSSSGGDVFSSISSVIDNSVTRFDSTTGKIIQDSSVTIDDAGQISTPLSIKIDTVDALKNTSYGFQTLNAVTTGNANVSIGEDSLLLSTTASNNVTIGISTMEKNISSSQNVAIGAFAMRYQHNTGVSAGNVAVGYEALLGIDGTSGNAQENTAIGHNALQNCRIGSRNIGIGPNSQHDNERQTSNISIGYNCMSELHKSGGTNSENLAIGNESQRDNKPEALDAGFHNVSIGFKTLEVMQPIIANDSINNTVIGWSSGLVLTTAADCTFLGNGSGIVLTTGDNNLFLGADSGNTITTTSNNICIGSVGVVADSGQIRIGTNATHTKCDIQGVYSVAPAGILQTVTINSSGQLGSSSNPHIDVAFPDDFIDGLVVNGGATDARDISAGTCRDSTNAFNITYAGGTAVINTGTGVDKLDTGTPSSNTWYYFFVISNNDSSTVASLISLSSTAPTLPATYTIFRMLCPVRYNSTSNFLNFHMLGVGRDRWVVYEEIPATMSMIAAGAATTYTAMTMTGIVPPISDQITFNFRHKGTADGDFACVFTGLSGSTVSTNERIISCYAGANTVNVIGSIKLNGSQQTFYGNSAASNVTNIHLISFLVEL